MHTLPFELRYGCDTGRSNNATSISPSARVRVPVSEEKSETEPFAE